jgi:hypothetical protein
MCIVRANNIFFNNIYVYSKMSPMKLLKTKKNQLKSKKKTKGASLTKFTFKNNIIFIFNFQNIKKLNYLISYFKIDFANKNNIVFTLCIQKIKILIVLDQPFRKNWF